MGGLKNSSKVYLIDLGNAKKFIKKDGTHIPFRDGRNLAGCPRFASLNGHLGL
jgi:casein kinase 1